MIERILLVNSNKDSKLLGIFGRIPVFFLLSFIWFILIASLVCRAEYCSYRYFDNPAWVSQDAVFLIISSILILAALIIIYITGKQLKRFGRKQVLCTLMYFSVLLQLLFILYFPAKPFADQEIVNRIAHEVINGNFQAFDKMGYLYQYPNNIGITLLLSAIYKIFPQSLMVPKLLNIAFSIAASYIVFRIYEEVFPSKRNDFGILIIACFFPPMIMLNNLVYNDIYATTLFLGAVFYAIRYTKTNNWRYLVPAGILLTAGNFLRQLGAIFLLSIIVYFIIKRVLTLKSFLFFIMVIMACKAPMLLVNDYLIENEKITEPVGLNSIPVHMWIHMGMNEEKFGYWDDSASYNIYFYHCECSKSKSEQAYRLLIKEKLRNKGLLNLAKVYLKKNVWLWTEGTYQAEYYGVGSWGHLYSTVATINLDSSVLFRDSIRWALHVLNTIMLSLIFAGLLYCIGKKVSYRLLLPAIVVIGFIGFYTVWEIKPRYIYPIYPYLILMAYQGLDTLFNSLSSLLRMQAVEN
jgi:hypothetical protein